MKYKTYLALLTGHAIDCCRRPRPIGQISQQAALRGSRVQADGWIKVQATEDLREIPGRLDEINDVVAQDTFAYQKI